MREHRESTTTVTVSTKQDVNVSTPASKTLIWTFFISLILVATLFMPLVIGEGYEPVFKHLFGDDATMKFYQMTWGSAFCGIIGVGESAQFVEIIANVFYWGYIVMLGIAVVDLVLTIINMAFKGLRPLNKIINAITTFVLFFCWLVMFVSLALVVFMHMDGGFDFIAFLTRLGYLYILWFVLSLWLFILKIKLGKRM
ncbi:MAG: hypothetical protein J6C90_01890 [Clostridia bacterium]|nr:hypothetical protein [Clostridia bacterium]